MDTADFYWGSSSLSYDKPANGIEQTRLRGANLAFSTSDEVDEKGNPCEERTNSEEIAYIISDSTRTRFSCIRETRLPKNRGSLYKK